MVRQEEGCIICMRYILCEFLGHNFVSRLRMLKPINLKTYSKNLGFSALQCTKFTEDINDNTDGISKNRLSPYNALYLNYNFFYSLSSSSTVWIWDLKLFSRAIYTTLWYIIPLVSYPISKHILSNIKSSSSFEQFNVNSILFTLHIVNESDNNNKYKKIFI